MIKLTLPYKPAKLAEEEAALTRDFILSGGKKPVWRKDYIIEPLLEMSHNKCAYSEIKLNQKSTYMEVEHFKHKSQYPNDVVNWSNLLPSCKKCNDTKGTHDVMSEPIVNPVFDNPGVHLYVKAYRFYERDEKGKNTIKKVALNDEVHFVEPRHSSAEIITEQLEDKFALLKKAATSEEADVRIRSLKKILKSCGPHSEFSAVIATHILYEWKDVGILQKYLNDNGYWDQEFEDLFKILKSIALPL